MRIWLDDIRPMPEEYDIWVKNANQCIDILKSGKAIHISFDHDLGSEQNGTGYDVAKRIEKYAYFNAINKISWDIHSQNPVGAQNIVFAMKNAERYWETNNRIFISIGELKNSCIDCDPVDMPMCDKCIGS